MRTVKKATVKNISAGPSKKTPVAGPVDAKGQYTKVQQRTLGNMRKGGKIRKYQNSGPNVPMSKNDPLPTNYPPMAQVSGKTKTKTYSSSDGSDKRDYVTINKTKVGPGGKSVVTKSKVRRTVGGFLTGAPKVQKNGGKTLKKQAAVAIAMKAAGKKPKKK